MRKNAIRLGFLSLIVIACYMAAAADNLHIKIDSDTVKVAVGEDSDEMPLSDLADNDTLRIWNYDSLTFYGVDGPQVLRKINPIMPVVIESPIRTVRAYIWFYSISEVFRERVGLLRKFENFGATQPGKSLRFAYSPSNDSNLVKLKEKYHLDKIAGDGSEISRMINLMKWVHGQIRHDGSSPNPDPRDALHILEVCADSGRGVNCRMLATVLNEVYLATGFKSRHLTCMPEDKNDNDCHVINMVWSDSLNKWIYMDPSFQGYFTDPAGVMLSPLEVREAFINGDSLVVNSDLDFNGRPYPQADYKRYMVKNLFRFVAPLVSEFGYESKPQTDTWVYLNPLGYDSDMVNHADTLSGKTRSHIDYSTDNGAWFWEQ